MTSGLEDLRMGLIRLRDAVLASLSPTDQRQVTDLIEADEFGVALEWIVDSLAEAKRAVPRSALELIVEAARKMEMYPAILDRLPKEAE